MKFNTFEEVPEGTLCGSYCSKCRKHVTHKKKNNKWICFECEVIIKINKNG